MKLKDIFEKHPLSISLSLFTFAFIVSRILFLICPFVEISYDSIEYSNFFDLYLSQGKLPPNDYTPLGYPFLVKCISLVSNSVYVIIGLQMLIDYLVCALVLFSISKFYRPTYSILTSIALSFFILSPNNVYYDVSVLSESLYNSSLVFIVASAIWAVNSKEKWAWQLLSLSLALPVLFRPNGLFTVILIFFAISYLFFNARKTIYVFATPFLSIWLLLSAYSYFANGEFSVISSKRVKGSTATTAGKKRIEQASEEIVFRFIKRIAPHYNHFNNQRSFYHKLEDLKRKYIDQQYVKKVSETEEFFFPLTEVEKKRAFKEFYDTTHLKQLAQKQQTITQGFFFKIFDFYQLKFESKFVTNYIWQWIMVLAFMYSFFILIQTRFTNATAFLLFFVIAINIGTNLISILSTQRQLPRYEYPAEFLFHLSIVFLIVLVQERRGHVQ